MHMPLRLPHLTGAVLLAATSFAGAEAPLPDPVAPAVIGRPLDQIRPARPVRAKPAAAKPKQVAAGNKAVPERPSAPVVVVPAAVQQAPSSQRIAKQAVDDRADPGTHVPDDVGKGTRLASKPLAPGAYFSGKHQALVRKYYEAHPVSGRVASWKIGEPVPPRTALTGVPDDLRAALPVLPPGHQYVQLDGEVVLVAVQSRMVVDGVSRGVR
jgi:Ni/Co efflux regulator RcnB